MGSYVPSSKTSNKHKGMFFVIKTDRAVNKCGKNMVFYGILCGFLNR